MSGRLIVIGGGGYARELIQYALDLKAAGTGDGAAGYLDDGGDVLAALGYDLPWLGSIAEHQPLADDRYLLAIGSPAGKRKVAEMLLARGAAFPPFFHPTCLVTARTSVGEGAVMGPYTGTGVDTQIGRFVTVNSYSGFGHDSAAGDFTTLSAHVDVMGYARLGSEVFVGSHASILPKVKVGNGAQVGAGAMVYRSVPAGVTVYAQPAKRLRTRTPA